jgi:hypothetical protein
VNIQEEDQGIIDQGENAIGQEQSKAEAEQDGEGVSCGRGLRTRRGRQRRWLACLQWPSFGASLEAVLVRRIR